jgi:hypothetical protein
VLGVRRKKGDRPDSNRHRPSSPPGMLPLHHSHHGARTTGLEPAASRWTAGRSTPLSYVRVSSAGGIRTHGLELMRLARTAGLLYRAICPAGFEPALSGSRNRRDGQPSLRADEVPPAGLEPAASRLRAGRHFPFDHGGVDATSRRCWNRTNPCGVSDRRAATDTNLRKLRRQASNLLFAGNSRASFPFDLTGMKRKERESNPQGRERPTRFRDGIPRRVAVLPEEANGPGRSRTCTAPIKSRGLYRVELRNHECGRLDSNQRRAAFQAAALPG